MKGFQEPKKNFSGIFMTEKVDTMIYHIYLKDKCLYHSLSEEGFKQHWEMLCNMIDLLNNGYTKEDLSYTSVCLPKKEEICSSSY